jgi:hypothetical protein
MGCRGEERTKGEKEYTITLKIDVEKFSRVADKKIAEAIIGGGIGREEFIKIGEQVNDIILLRLVKEEIAAMPNLRFIELVEDGKVLAKADFNEGIII